MQVQLLLPAPKIKPQVSLRLFSYLFIDFNASRTRILEVTVEFKRYVKAAVLIFVYVYLADEQAHIRIRDVRFGTGL